MTDVVVRWTAEAIQEAIQKPTKFLANPHWLQYSQQLGGITQLYTYMSTMPLKEKEQLLLATLLHYPGASVDTYTQLLHIHPATFHRHQKQLFEHLAACLNSQQVDHPPHDRSKEFAKFHGQPIIGREQEQALIQRLLEQKDIRLITLTGLGGIGKTTLALSIISLLQQSFNHGAVFIQLSEFNNNHAALRAIANKLGIVELNKHSLLQQIQEYLYTKQLLLVIDNLEHLVDFDQVIDHLIKNTVSIKILITSRTVLNLNYEQVILINPLDFPDENIYNWQDIAEYPAIRLFYQCATTADPSFQITNQNASFISQICRLVSGIPLAIEIIAAYIRYSSIEDLYTNIQQSLLSINTTLNNHATRHQNLHNIIDWSFQQLDSETQACFVLLGCGQSYTWDYAAAQSWTQLDQTSFSRCLKQLIDRHLIQVDRSNKTTRYSMHTVVAVFIEHLFQVDAQRDSVMQRYYNYYAQHMQQAATKIQATSLQAPIYAAIKQEYPHYRRSLIWFLSQPSGSDALELIRSLWRFWLTQGFAVEGYAWCQQLLASQTLSNEERARLNLITGNIARLQGALHAAKELFKRTLGLWQALEHSEGITWGLANYGLTAVMLGDYAEAKHYLAQALEHTQKHNHGSIQAICYGNSTELALEQADYANAAAAAQQALIYWQAHNDLWGQATVLRYQAIIHFEQRRFKECKNCLEDAYQFGLLAGDHSLIGMLATHLGALAIHNAHLAQAYQWLYQALTIHQQLGDLCELARTLEYLACYYTTIHSYKRALMCLSRSDNLHRQTQRQRSVYEQAQFTALLDQVKHALGSDWIGIWHVAHQQAVEMQMLAQP
ncbi:ATP-binding protein [Herpetosiphon giganteus]|uniref:ATP-binding protein n=1 Tax=Herpetosiphon giganteus TaxID=2029754 RepID=UPI00195A8CAE|nr:NB-ARC domain-containing protein [Herpetosiphon giganteus]MBM7844931.1 putative ATPase [Herpetosiphon giganteus]